MARIAKRTTVNIAATVIGFEEPEDDFNARVEKYLTIALQSFVVTFYHNLLVENLTFTFDDDPPAEDEKP